MSSILATAHAKRLQSLTERGANVSVHVTRDLHELPFLRSQWDALFQSRPNEPSTSFEWTEAMSRHHVRAGDRRFLVRLERNNRLIGLVPLVVRKLPLMGVPVRVLAPISEDYNTHSDLLLAAIDDDIADAFMSAVFSLSADWDMFRMSRLLECNALTEALQRALGREGRMHLCHSGPSAYVLQLPKTYAAYLSERSAKFRNHLKRAEKKLLGAGEVEIRELSTADDVETAFGVLLQVERASWKHGFRTAITSIERQANFYRDFMHAAASKGALHFQLLSLDGKPLAYNLGYLTASGYHYLKTSYDHAHRSLGPATVLRARLIESLISRGLQQMDFPGDPYEWEAQWTKTVRERLVLRVYAPSVRGLAMAAIDRLRHRTSTGQLRHVDPRRAH